MTDRQMIVASQLLSVVRARGLPHRAGIIILETGIVESGLRVLANPNVPESLLIPNDGLGSDYDSVGPLQQRVPMWGSASDCMNPVTSAGKFLDRLVTFGWQSLTTGDAAQAVQGSAFPDRYQLQENNATSLVYNLWLPPLIVEDEEMKLLSFGQATYLLFADGHLKWVAHTADVLTYQALGVPGPKPISADEFKTFQERKLIL